MSRYQLCFLFVLLGAAAVRADAPIGELEEQQFLAAAAKVAPSVVRIETFGGLEKVGELLVGTGPTTGLVVHEDGFIISSAFNFVQQPSSILVTLPGGKRAAATIVARDHSRMLVLLKAKTEEKLPVPQAAPREELTTGQWTIALGRTFDGERPNMSIGVMSATNRIWGKAVQTDAKISPSNYGGPLIDVRGRVIGVLVPASPQGQGEIAGAEWYDSGIGFAVPLVDIMAHLETLKQGKDLHAGLLGIALKGTNVQVDPAEISACQANSPAAMAGFKAGDKIVEIDGRAIASLAQLRHALGPHYAGDKVKVVALRGDKRIEGTVQLIDKLLPYQHPFLGILPRRDADRSKGGVIVRYVYSNSPAAESQIKIGDRLISLSGTAIRDPQSLQDLVAAQEVGKSIPLQVESGGQTREVTLKLAAIPNEVPAELPSPHGEPPAEVGERGATGVVTIKLPEEKSECLAYVPETYQSETPHGVVIWLHAAGGYEQEELVARWKEQCQKHDLILLAPKSVDKTRWDPTEVAFVRKSLDDLMKRYNIDRTRIVVHGLQAGGAMAFLVADGHRDLIRGVATVDAPLPARLAKLENEPTQRLAFYLAWAEKAKAPEAFQAGAKKLQELKFPVTTRKTPGEPRNLSPDELAEMVRWVDTLDRS